jgi:hypothetical protein
MRCVSADTKFLPALGQLRTTRDAIPERSRFDGHVDVLRAISTPR